MTLWNRDNKVELWKYFLDSTESTMTPLERQSMWEFFAGREEIVRERDDVLLTMNPLDIKPAQMRRLLMSFQRLYIPGTSQFAPNNYFKVRLREIRQAINQAAALNDTSYLSPYEAGLMQLASWEETLEQADTDGRNIVSAQVTLIINTLLLELFECESNRIWHIVDVATAMIRRKHAAAILEARTNAIAKFLNPLVVDGNSQEHPCPICQVQYIKQENDIEGSEAAVQFPCAGRHVIGRSCALTWFTTKLGATFSSTCPCCRADFTQAIRDSNNDQEEVVELLNKEKLYIEMERTVDEAMDRELRAREVGAMIGHEADEFRQYNTGICLLLRQLIRGPNANTPIHGGLPV